jgi:glutaredoxin 2
MAGLNGIYTEIYHCPFDPTNIDLILLPINKVAILDISGHIVDYEKNLPAPKYKRMLDFDQFLDRSAINPYEPKLAATKDRFQNGLEEAITFIQTAKNLHDELETYYVPAMYFARIEEFRKELVNNLLDQLKEL